MTKSGSQATLLRRLTSQKKVDLGRSASASNIEWLVGRVLVLKYFVFLATLATAAVWLLRDSAAHLSDIEFAKGVFYAVLSALLISIFYDLFTRREMRILHETEKAELQETLEKKFLYKLDLNALTDAEMRTLS